MSRRHCLTRSAPTRAAMPVTTTATTVALGLSSPAASLALTVTIAAPALLAFPCHLAQLSRGIRTVKSSAPATHSAPASLPTLLALPRHRHRRARHRRRRRHRPHDPAHHRPDHPRRPPCRRRHRHPSSTTEGNAVIFSVTLAAHPSPVGRALIAVRRARVARHVKQARHGSAASARSAVAIDFAAS